MSRPRLLLALCALFLVWWLLPWPKATQARQEQPPAQPVPALPPTLPLTQVVLYDNGLAYFQREGQVTGNAQLELRIPARNMNDLLKSIVTEDTGGGQIAAVRLDPPHARPSDLAMTLGTNSNLEAMLHAARGEKVEVHLHPTRNNPQPAPLPGIVLGISTEVNQLLPSARPSIGPGGPVDGETMMPGNSSLGFSFPTFTVSVVNLHCQEGLTSLPISRIKSVRLLDPDLDAEVQRSASMLSSRAGSELHTIRLSFNGSGRRSVRIGYVTEHPLWRTSYRLLLAKEGKATLQGWALLENVTEEDWHNVSLTLMAGQPNSFQIDLATPLHQERPVLLPKRHEELRNQPYLPSYPLALSMQMSAIGDMTGLGGMGGLGGLGGGLGGLGGGLGGLGGGLGGLGGGLGGGGLGGFSGLLPQQRPGMLDPAQSVKTVADSARAGDFYSYTLPGKVSIPRRQAAMLPVMQRPIAGDAFTLHRPASGEKDAQSQLSFRLKNDTGMQLSAGPVTVIDRNNYGGEAMLEDVMPGEETTLSFATDLATKVKRKEFSGAKKNGPVTVLIGSGGIKIVETEQRRTKYILTRSLAEPRRMMIEHPVSEDWKLVEPKPWKEEEDVFLFQTETIPGKEAVFEVVEETLMYRTLQGAPGPDGVYRHTLDDFTELTLQSRAQPAQLQSVRIIKGTVEETRRISLDVQYTLKHRGKEAREVTLVHSPAPQAVLAVAEPGAKTQDKEGWHFLHRVPVDGTSTQKLQEQRREATSWNLGQADRAKLLQLRNDPAASAAVKAAVQKTLDFHDRLLKLETDRTALRERLTEIELDQRRLRANLKELPPASAAYKKHLDKFDKQEEELEKLTAEEKKLRLDIAQAQKDRETFLAGVAAE
jgi:hypothetical protein